MSSTASALCHACDEASSRTHTVIDNRRHSIDHTRASFILSVYQSCQLCTVICRSLFGWVRSHNGAGETAGELKIPHDFQLRYRFSLAPVDSYQFSSTFASLDDLVTQLDPELKYGDADSFRETLQTEGLALRLEMWNGEDDSLSVTMEMQPLIPESQIVCLSRTIYV